jgi:hypothetical protein
MGAFDDFARVDRGVIDHADEAEVHGPFTEAAS